MCFLVINEHNSSQIYVTYMFAYNSCHSSYEQFCHHTVHLFSRFHWSRKFYWAFGQSPSSSLCVLSEMLVRKVRRSSFTDGRSGRFLDLTVCPLSAWESAVTSWHPSSPRSHPASGSSALTMLPPLSVDPQLPDWQEAAGEVGGGSHPASGSSALTSTPLWNSWSMQMTSQSFIQDGDESAHRQEVEQMVQ